MIKCECGGYIAELGESEDQNNPCICKDLKIKELEKQNEELITLLELTYSVSHFTNSSEHIQKFIDIFLEKNNMEIVDKQDYSNIKFIKIT